MSPCEIPSSRVRLMQRSCLNVAESSTTRKAFLLIRSSLLPHTQQVHKSLDRPELPIGKGVEFRADKSARRMSRKQVHQPVIKRRQAALVRKKLVHGDDAHNSLFDFQRNARAYFPELAGILSEKGLAGLSDQSLQPFAEGYAAA